VAGVPPGYQWPGPVRRRSVAGPPCLARASPFWTVAGRKLPPQVNTQFTLTSGAMGRVWGRGSPMRPVVREPGRVGGPVCGNG
jgi:hypothetical protein